MVIVADSGSRGRSLAQRLPALGVDYGKTGNNLFPPSVVAKMVHSTSISKLKLYGADPAILQFCTAKSGADEQTLEANLNYVCGQGIECRPIQQGCPCYSPNTVAGHAAYAMNAYYQTAGRNNWNCDFA